MVSVKTKKSKIVLTALVLIAVLGMSFFVYSKLVDAADPTGVHLTVYQTDLMTGAGGSTATVFTNAVGQSVDIVGNPDVFGEGAVVAGTYKRIKFTVRNLVSFTGPVPSPCTGPSPTTMQFRIDGTQGDDAHVELYFATADDGGSSGWTANGTAATPFLIQNPIVVEASATIIVKLIFNTTGTLQCVAGETKVLGPTMTVMYYIDQPPATAGYCANLGDYWFFHYRLASYPTDSQGNLITSPTLTDIMQHAQVVSGWGTMTLSPPSSTGTGTWSVDPTRTYENNGMAEHRHSLYRLESGDGLYNPNDPAGAVMNSSYLFKGNKLLLNFPDEFTIDGAMSTDCSTFVGVTLEQKGGSDLIVALKKTDAATTPVLPFDAKMVMIGPQVNMRYAAVGAIVNGFGYDSGWSVMQFNSSGSANGRQMEWKNRFEMSPLWSSGSWSIRPPEEAVGFSQNLDMSTLLTIAPGGLITQMNGAAPEDFAAVGANGNIIMAGERTDVSVRFPGTHRITAGAGVRLADAPVLSDLTGKWSIGMLETRLEGTTGWNTGVSYGDITISQDPSTGRYQGCGGFTYRDNFSSQIHPPEPGCVAIELHNECYAGDGVPVATTPCTSGITIPVFHVIDPSGGLDAKFVLDYNKNVILVWGLFDADNRPCDSDTAPGCTPDPSDRTSAGLGVKIQ